MIISKKAKLAFIHIPKNAGRSIEKAMRDKWPCKRVGWGHSTLSQVKNETKGLRTFAVVRNPWERMVSLYFFVMQKKKTYTTKNGKKRPVKELAKLGFSTWLTERGEMTNNMIFTETPQVNWLRIMGKIAVKHIIRYENLGELKKLGIKLKEHTHKSKHGHYCEYYDKKARDFVANKFREDIKEFGYKYENKHRD